MLSADFIFSLNAILTLNKFQYFVSRSLSGQLLAAKNYDLIIFLCKLPSSLQLLWCMNFYIVHFLARRINFLKQVFTSLFVACAERNSPNELLHNVTIPSCKRGIGAN